MQRAEERKGPYSAHSVMELPGEIEVCNLSEGFDASKINRLIERDTWCIGGYLEKRTGMYTAPQYKNSRNVHMGIDIWAKAGKPVYSPFDGKVCYLAYHPQQGNYGGTVVSSHQIDGREYYILFGHLSKDSTENLKRYQPIKRGTLIGRLGSWEENGNWPPHLHLQVSIKDPGEADMPGVVAPEEVEWAKKIYPDPRVILGDLYE